MHSVLVYRPRFGCSYEPVTVGNAPWWWLQEEELSLVLRFSTIQ